ncbi:MAG: fused MFS/spermidine synthase [Coriobacteriales bacterium]|nr:fused MFS/spermidine synthase [Coriobacteriales bacterium]
MASLTVWAKQQIRRLFAIRRPTMFGTARIYEDSDGVNHVRVLDMGGTYQSATYLDTRWYLVPFRYLMLFDRVFEAQIPIRNVCMLGGGGYAYPKQLIALHPEARIDVVEIDPAITNIAKEFFYLDRLIDTYHLQENGRLGIYSEDALTYLQRCQARGRRYDAIMNDCFVVEQKDSSLETAAALKTIHDCLVPNGLYLINVISALEGDLSSSLTDLLALAASEFGHVHALSCGKVRNDEVDNMVIVASDLDHGIRDAIHLYDSLSDV